MNPKTTSSTWKESIRWFSAEFLVVVSGVLIALALNSFWQSRLDSSREAAYLDQIRTDIQETQQQFSEALQFNENMLLALDSLSMASNGLISLSNEEIIRLNDLDFLWAVPVTGTVEALVSTGELHLISSDSLRTSVIQFVNESEAFESILLEYVFRWGGEGYRVIWESLVAPSEEESRFYSSPNKVIQTEEYYDALQLMRLTYLNILSEQRKLYAKAALLSTSLDQSR